MTENEPQHPEVDDLGLTSEDWEDLQIRLHLRPVSIPLPGPSTRKRSAGWTLRPARSRALAALEEADEAWRASRPGRAPQAGAGTEAGQ